MKSIYNVPQDELIEKTAIELKKIQSIKAPAWSEFVKTGTHKERAPARDDWWYVRAAAILRTIYKIGPIGVSKLRVKYGGKKDRGVKPEKFYKGSGKIIRTILQQLEGAELVKKAEKGIHKGRIIAPKGISFLDKVAARISGKKPQIPQKEKPSELKKEIKKPEEKIIKKPEVIEKKPRDIKEKPKEEKPIAQKTEKVEKKPEVKKQDIKTEQSQEIKKPAEEKKQKIPTAAELAKKTKEKSSKK